MPNITTELADLYSDIQEAYAQTATLLNFTCQECPDNCCNSYFQHHTYIEWAYLWEGLALLSQEQRDEYLTRAKDYNRQSEHMAEGHRPEIMCPLNNAGRCGLYTHRLLICRLHGVPASITFPNGQKRGFPGCFRCQEITANLPNVTTMDRTLFFKRMLKLERAFVGPRLNALPKVKMTLAQMLIAPPPI